MRRIDRAWWVWTLLLLPLLGCGSSDVLATRDQIEVGAGFRTDATAYRMRSQGSGVVATIGITLENRFQTALLPVPCTEEAPEWTLERRVGEQWSAVATGACLLVSWTMNAISPGATYRGVVRLTTAVEPGTYRLVFGLLEVTADATLPVVDGRARSNTFLLTD